MTGSCSGADPSDREQFSVRWRIRLPGIFEYGRRVLSLAWNTNKTLLMTLMTLVVITGILPIGSAYVSYLMVDAVVRAATLHRHSGVVVLTDVFTCVALTGLLVAVTAMAERVTSFTQSLLRAQLGQRINVMIMEKALTLELLQFEDSEFYDKLSRARREASIRPLGLIVRTFGLLQSLISLVAFGGMLLRVSPLALCFLMVVGLPAFFAEAKFSSEGYRKLRSRAPESRMLLYLESLLSREETAKEIKSFQLGMLLLDRYKKIFAHLYREDRNLALHHESGGFVVGLLGTVALYAGYTWIADATVMGRMTIGQMTMYLLLLRQGQSAVAAALKAISGLYEDNLYLSNLFEYLEQPVRRSNGTLKKGSLPRDGLRFEDVEFTYPGAATPTLTGITLHVQAGESLALVGQNGSGKTTLIKLLTRLYRPTKGRILLDGVDLQEWDESALRQRVGVIFQEFERYEMLAGENIGVGDVLAFEDEGRWRRAASQGLAEEFIERLPSGYQTRLGKSFQQGHELSGGQWQRIALARVFMRREADILVLDEPTSALDAGTEAEIFDRFRELMRGRIAIVISHRFSTVRRSDQILVLKGGRVIERGTHETLMEMQGYYARLFSLQANGYR
jgi:ATP-binding cassette, subfamily B, bacterial